ncbi:MAG: LptF/LptG family permease [Bacteroidaceae bacterium]|nr:LptF/LptG family permease [Bacteroidaceae bacterium]MBQ8888125.1 LptF/LptG family permease [Bacteroidaceae bacterium]
MKSWLNKIKQSLQKVKGGFVDICKKLKLDKWIMRLDRYIIAKFLGTYFFSIALIISIAVVFDINENIDKFINNNAPVKAIIFDYYLNFIPYFSNLFSSLFVFIAVIFFTSKLADNSEIIAMMSTGMSFKRLMRPYMISAAIIAVLTYGLGAYVIPKGNVTRLDFEDKYRKKKKKEFVRNVQLEVDNGVIAYLERYEDRNKTAYRFSLDKFIDKKLVSHLTAKQAVYDTTSTHKWKLKDYMIREMDGLRETITTGKSLDSIIKMEPQDFLIMKGQQQTMTSPQLKEYITKQKQRGFANIKEFEIEYHQRIAMSFAAFILTTIGLSLSSKKVKGGMGMNLGIGLALSFSYILFQTVSATFTTNGNTPPIVAVWIPNIIYAFIAVYLYRKAPK